MTINLTTQDKNIPLSGENDENLRNIGLNVMWQSKRQQTATADTTSTQRATTAAAKPSRLKKHETKLGAKRLQNVVKIDLSP